MPISTVHMNPNTDAQTGGAEPRGLGFWPFGYSPSPVRRCSSSVSQPEWCLAHHGCPVNLGGAESDPKAVPTCPANVMGATAELRNEQGFPSSALLTLGLIVGPTDRALCPETPAFGSASRKSSSSLGAASQPQAPCTHLSLLRL